MTPYKQGEAGKRAAREIRRTADEIGTHLKDELEHLGVSQCVLWNWDHGKVDPSVQWLYALWLGGYDIVYIVTGVREADPDAARVANAYQRKKRKLVVTG